MIKRKTYSKVFKAEAIRLVKKDRLTLLYPGGSDPCTLSIRVRSQTSTQKLKWTWSFVVIRDVFLCDIVT
jgi:hypothetical protein